MKLVSNRSLTGIIGDVYRGAKKAALIVVAVPLLTYALRRATTDDIGPASSTPGIERAADCITCHEYRQNTEISNRPRDDTPKTRTFYEGLVRGQYTPPQTNPCQSCHDPHSGRVERTEGIEERVGER